MFAFLFFLGLGQFSGKELGGDGAAILMLACVAVAAGVLGVDFAPILDVLMEACDDILYVLGTWFERLWAS